MPKLGIYYSSYSITYVTYIFCAVVYDKQCSLAVQCITGTSHK